MSEKNNTESSDDKNSVEGNEVTSCSTVIENEKKDEKLQRKLDSIKKARETRLANIYAKKQNIQNLAKKRRSETELKDELTKRECSLEKIKIICEELKEKNKNLILELNGLRFECKSIRELNESLQRDKSLWKEEALRNMKDKQSLDEQIVKLNNYNKALKKQMANLRRSYTANKKRSNMKVTAVEELASDKS